MDNILVFSLENCNPCRELKLYLEQKGVEYTLVEVPKEMSIDTFKKIYPENKGFPHILVNGRIIYDLMMYLESGLEV